MPEKKTNDMGTPKPTVEFIMPSTGWSEKRLEPSVKSSGSPAKKPTASTKKFSSFGFRQFRGELSPFYGDIRKQMTGDNFTKGGKSLGVITGVVNENLNRLSSFRGETFKYQAVSIFASSEVSASGAVRPGALTSSVLGFSIVNPGEALSKVLPSLRGRGPADVASKFLVVGLVNWAWTYVSTGLEIVLKTVGAACARPMGYCLERANNATSDGVKNLWRAGAAVTGAIGWLPGQVSYLAGWAVAQTRYFLDGATNLLVSGLSRITRLFGDKAKYADFSYSLKAMNPFVTLGRDKEDGPNAIKGNIVKPAQNYGSTHDVEKKMHENHHPLHGEYVPSKPSKGLFGKKPVVVAKPELKVVPDAQLTLFADVSAPQPTKPKVEKISFFQKIKQKMAKPAPTRKSISNIKLRPLAPKKIRDFVDKELGRKALNKK